MRRSQKELSDRYVRTAVRRGSAIRIAPGSSAAAAAWNALDPAAQHAQRTWEAAARLAPGAVFSHHSTAAL